MIARVLRSIPAVVAVLLLAAHFYRAAAIAPAVACVAAAPLVFVKRPWAVWALRLGLAAGTVIWMLTAWRIAQERMAAGAPYLRMIAILSVVAVFTAIAAWMLPSAPPSREVP